MFISNEANLSRYFSLPNPGLESYLDKTQRGNSEEYRTTFAKGKKVQQILKEWKGTLDQIEKEWPTLLEFENDLAKKVGPMSVQKPLKDRMKDIESYYESILLDSKPISHSAEAAVLREWVQVKRLATKDTKASS